jgi:AraC-like DNA-binding protein
MTVTTDEAAYVVPPQRAVWMPGGVGHSIAATGKVHMRTLYIETAHATGLPTQVQVLQVTSLLRELIVAAVASGPSYDSETPEARLVAVILDQIRTQPVANLFLPMPTDARLVRLTRALLLDPADPRDLDAWAKDVGASARTLTRQFTAQTGMSFRSWRQQCKLHRALELLAAGDSVTTIASSLGYDNTSAFIAMFKRHFGTTPARYLTKGYTAPD